MILSGILLSFSLCSSRSIRLISSDPAPFAAGYTNPGSTLMFDLSKEGAEKTGELELLKETKMDLRPADFISEQVGPCCFFSLGLYESCLVSLTC